MSKEREELNRKREAAKKNQTKSNLAKAASIVLSIVSVVIFGKKMS